MEKHEIGSTYKSNQNFLEGIGEFEQSKVINKRLLDGFIDKGIISVLQDREKYQQLDQYSMKLLKEFHEAFPGMSLDELFEYQKMKQEQASNNKSFLDGIELDEIANRGKDRLLKFYIDQGIVEVLKKAENKEQLMQQEMKLLKEFRDDFPSMTLEQVLDFKNKTNKEQASNSFSWLNGIEEL